MVERSLSMREVPGSIPGFSSTFCAAKSLLGLKFRPAPVIDAKGVDLSSSSILTLFIVYHKALLMRVKYPHASTY